MASFSLSRFCGHVRFLLAMAAPVQAGPKAPDVLEIVVVDNGQAEGTVTVEAVVKQKVTAKAELEIEDGGGTKLLPGGRKKQFMLRRGGAESRERVQVKGGRQQRRSIRATLRLLNPDGSLWMTIQRAVNLNEPAAPAADKLVPAVQTLPDGSRIVEYITSREAIARGLPAEGSPVSPPAAAPSPGPGTVE